MEFIMICNRRKPMFNEPSEKELAKIPKLYSTEDVPFKEKMIYLHFFLCSSDWYIAEFNGKKYLSSPLNRD